MFTVHLLFYFGLNGRKNVKNGHDYVLRLVTARRRIKPRKKKQQRTVHHFWNIFRKFYATVQNVAPYSGIYIGWKPDVPMHVRPSVRCTDTEVSAVTFWIYYIQLLSCLHSTRFIQRHTKNFIFKINIFISSKPTGTWNNHLPVTKEKRTTLV